MKKIFLLLYIAVFTSTYSQTTAFNDLLQKHVDKKGNVDYKALKKEEAKLNLFLTSLQKANTTKFDSENAEKAFWINAYNAYTIKIILSNYPTTSIMNIKRNDKTAWKISFAKVGSKTYTLDYIEHEILRKKFKDPRIHVGVNCASISCPKLANIAFTADNIENELERLMKEFVNDSTKNKISKSKIEISEIFNWFKGDFTTEGTIIEYLNKYSKTEINKKAKIKYLTYDWNLNGK
ncbi:MAG: DUF547 domain-containing protein [Flavobacteriaceae bacterium]